MRVALLSAGPSLLRTFNDAMQFDARIGVNRAVEHFACDWWSVGDWQTITVIKVTPIGSPRIYTMDSSAGELGWPDLTRWNEVGIPLAPPKEWSTWSATAAIVLARHLGATSLDIYGADLHGSIDCSGRAGRDEHRWQREKPVWEACIQWIRAQGVRVVIHQPNGSPEVVAA